jgi:hypothetical protein
VSEPPQPPPFRPTTQPLPSAPPEPTPEPQPSGHKRSGRGWTPLLASLLAAGICAATVALAAHNNWGPFSTGAPFAPTFTPGISNGQPSVNPTPTTPPNSDQPSPPPLDAAAFQTPAFLLVKAAPATQAVSDVLAPTLDCLPIGAVTSEQIETGGGELPLTYQCAGGGLGFGGGVFLFGEPQVQSDESATVIAGTLMSSQESLPSGVVAAPGTGGSTWWVMSAGVIAASALQANDPRCTSVSAPDACIANLFTVAPGYNVEATPQFDQHYAQDLAFMFVKGDVLVPQNSWGASDDLHVLIGERTSASGTMTQHAYFFRDIGEVGLDTSDGSKSITVVSHTIDEVTLAYALYDVGHSASFGSSDVQFEWSSGKFLTLDPLPPSSSSVNGSRL